MERRGPIHCSLERALRQFEGLKAYPEIDLLPQQSAQSPTAAPACVP